MKQFVFLFPALLCGGALFAQSADSSRPKPAMTVGLEGMAGMSVGNNTIAFNVGGPHLKLKIGKNAGLAIAAFPSLLIVNGKAEPRLGVGPRLDYRNFVLLAPGFFHNKSDKWIWTAGFGYKFH